LSKGYFSAGVDYEWSKWKDVEFYKFLSSDTENSNRYSFGVEFSIPDRTRERQNDILQILEGST